MVYGVKAERQSLEHIATPLSAQVGMNRAEVWVALTDGGARLEEFLRDFRELEVFKQPPAATGK